MDHFHPQVTLQWLWLWGVRSLPFLGPFEIAYMARYKKRSGDHQKVIIRPLLHRVSMATAQEPVLQRNPKSFNPSNSIASAVRAVSQPGVVVSPLPLFLYALLALRFCQVAELDSSSPALRAAQLGHSQSKDLKEITFVAEKVASTFLGTTAVQQRAQETFQYLKQTESCWLNGDGEGVLSYY